MVSVKKPRIYWTYYPKLRRGYWRVNLLPTRSTSNLEAWAFAHDMAREMNRALDDAGKPRP